MHLKRREEVDVLARDEGDEHADGAHEPRVKEHFATSGDHRDLLDGGDDVVDVVVREEVSLVRRAHEEALLVHDGRSGRVVVDLVADVLRKAVKEEVAELVARCDRLVVDHARRRRPARGGVVGEDDEPVLGRLVDGVVNRLLDISDEDSRALGTQGRNHRGEGLCKKPSQWSARHEESEELADLVLRFPKQLFLPQVINAQGFPDSCYEPTLERQQSGRNVVGFSLKNKQASDLVSPKTLSVSVHLMKEFKIPTAIQELVRREETGFARSRGEVGVLCTSNDEEELVLVPVERDDRDGEGGLVVLEVELENGGSLQYKRHQSTSGTRWKLQGKTHLGRIDDANARRPVPSRCPRKAKDVERQFRDLLVDLYPCGPLIGKELPLCGRGEGPVVRLDGVDELVLGADDELSRGVGERDRCLLDLGAEFGEGENSGKKTDQVSLLRARTRSRCSPEAVPDDADESFGAQFGGEAPCVIEGVEDEGRELQDALVGVVEPGAAGESEDGRGAVDRNSGELDGSRAEEPESADVNTTRKK